MYNAGVLNNFIQNLLKNFKENSLHPGIFKVIFTGTYE